MSAAHLLAIWRSTPDCPVPDEFTRVNFRDGTTLHSTRKPPTKPGIYVWQSDRDSVEHLAEVNIRDGVLVMRMLVSETDWEPVSEIRDCFWALVADITLNSEP